MNYLNNLKKLAITTSVLIVSFFFLSVACSFKTLRPASPIATQVLEPLVQEESRLEISGGWMSGEESKQVFGHDFPSRDVYPLKITIQNNTSKSYSLSASSVDLPRVDASTVAFKVTKSAIPRAIAYRVASLFFWPLAIPGTIDGIRVFSHHRSLKNEIRAKSLKDQEGETITPYSSLNRVLFVKRENIQPSVKVTLIDLATLDPTEFQLNTKNEINE